MLTYAINKVSHYKAQLKSVNFLVIEVLEDNADLILDIIALNQKQLYEQGLQSDGTPTGDYTERTIKIKEEKGQRTDHITLNDTGAFFDSMNVKFYANAFIIEADTIKVVVDYKDAGLTTDLLDRWPKALGLTQESLNEIRPKIKELLLAKIRGALAA